MGDSGEFKILVYLCCKSIVIKFSKMYSFFGKIEAKVDDKGRLFIPSNFREQLVTASEKDQIVIRKNDSGNFLDIYPMSVWNEELAAIESKLNLLNPEHYEMYMQHTEEASLLDIDKSGRILLPKLLAKELGIENEIVIIGTRSKMALWSRQRYEENLTNRYEIRNKKIALLSQ